MNDQVNAQALPEQVLIHSFNTEFARLHAQLVSIVQEVALEDLYRQTSPASGALSSDAPGANLLRSAAIVEQTCGGITANLWDDPFEWTLPETLTTSGQILDYLAEVESTRERAFARFAKDGDLLKQVAVPSGETRPLVALLLETLVRASHYNGRTVAALKLF